MAQAQDTTQITAADVSDLLERSPRSEAVMIRWLDTGEIDNVAAVLFSDISYSNRDREYDQITTAESLRQSNMWEGAEPTDEDFAAIAEYLNEN